MHILDIRPASQGGYEIWAQLTFDPSGPCEPIYLAPHLVAEMLLNGALTQAGQDMVLAVLTTRAIPVVPDNTNPQDSPIEAEFKRQRDLFKVNGIGYIYSNPNCTLEEVLAAVQPLAPMISGAFLIQTYIQGAFDNGYIAEATFEAFKNFICSRTLTELMSI